MKLMKSQREKRLFQLMCLIIGFVISIFLNGTLLVVSYYQHTNSNTLQEEFQTWKEDKDMELVAYQEQLEEMKSSMILLQEEKNQLLTQVKQTTEASAGGNKVAYLTFDDGPTDLTPKILDVLKEYGVHATFFVLGSKVKQHPELLKRMIEEGHAIGNHSNTHRYEKMYISLDALRTEIQVCNDEIMKAAGVQATAFRFPGGSSNSMFQRYAKDVPRSEFLKLVGDMGMVYHDWNVSSLDASYTSVTKEQIVNAVVHGAANKKMINVLMHDVNKNQATLQALPIIIEKLQELGYSIESITSNSVPVQHKIAS